MGKIVNRTSGVAADWQRQVVWLRINIAYIKAELPYLAEMNNDPKDIELLLAAFEEPFTRLCDVELGVFVLARLAEVDTASRAELIVQLDRLRKVFHLWVQKYHELVMKVREEAQGSLKESLLNGCGAEILRAHNAFVTIISNYVAELQH